MNKLTKMSILNNNNNNNKVARDYQCCTAAVIGLIGVQAALQQLVHQKVISSGRREAERDWQIKLACGKHALDVLGDARDPAVTLVFLEVLHACMTKTSQKIQCGRPLCSCWEGAYILKADLDEVVHDYGGIPNIRLDDLEKVGAVQAQELAQGLCTGREELRPVAQETDIADDFAGLGHAGQLHMHAHSACVVSSSKSYEEGTSRSWTDLPALHHSGFPATHSDAPLTWISEKS